jgi:hypothetical protein
MSSTDPKEPAQSISQKILSVDYGTKAVGLAMFAPAQEPYPLPYARLNYKSDTALLQDLLEQRRGVLVLPGLQHAQRLAHLRPGRVPPAPPEHCHLLTSWDAPPHCL